MLGLHDAGELRNVQELYLKACRDLKIHPTPLPEIEECPNCHNGFYKWTKRRVYCSPECRKHAHYIRRKTGGGHNV